MAKGKLYEVNNDGQLKWSFFSEDMVYLAGFSLRESAELYGGMYGYDFANPEKINAGVFDRQPEVKRDELAIRANSPTPALQMKGTSPVAQNDPAKRPGLRMGRKF